MAWTPLLLALLSHCTGSLSQPVLTQPPSLSASPGATARLTCTLRSDVSVGRNMYWYQQKPGSAPRFFLYYYSDSDMKLGPGVPSRVSGSKDTSTNTAHLLISGLQSEDEADYYCATWFRAISETSQWGVPLPLLFIPDCVCFVSGSRSQDVVTPEPAMTVSPGATVTLTCGSSTGAVVDGHYPHWIQQKSGQVPKALIYNTNNRHSWTPARFSGSIQGGKAVLTLAGAQPEDEAEYHCLLWFRDYPHSDRCRWGSEAQTQAQCTLCF
ncbi:hypothetical protein QTO34_011857 [Cnephaeus nilssonii]|uniref:Ig-like domain-containing protein n=1 Tax=Cnephaeus nilssonii TaxID=3371016 RepID=A0AA40HBK2_CNENI|nr:hypothetical protein QTO34_011857 [Eptesicus nilssonii]